MERTARAVTPLRLFRIVGFAAAFFIAFTMSQAVTAARNAGETVPGIHYAIGALSFFFLVGAYATERTQGPEQNVRKDMLWGLGSGGLAIVASRLLS
jgi:hypothetical protein